MGFIDSLNAWPRPIRYGLIAMIIAIPTAGVALVVWDMFLRTDDDQHDPTYEPKLVQVIDVCPSIVELSVGKAQPRLSKAEERIEASTNCVIPDIQLDPCDGEPADGHVQLRACSDLLKVDYEGKTIYGTGCPELLSGVEYDDTVEFHPSKVGTGVAYWDFFGGQPRTPEHILLHIVGVGWGTEERPDGHSTREPSVMFPTAGLSFDDVHCD